MITHGIPLVITTKNNNDKNLLPDFIFYFFVKMNLIANLEMHSFENC